MSGLAVRSYVKWAVDPNSFQKAQAQYNGHLARLQKDGVESTKATNDTIMAQHKQFVAQMDAVQKKANNELKTRTKQIAKEVAQSAKAAQAAAAGHSGKMTKAGKPFKRGEMKGAADEYSAALSRMSAANDKFVARAKAMGHTLQGGAHGIDTEGFGGLKADARADIIDMQRQEVALMSKTADGYKEQVALLRQAETIHRRMTREERKRDVTISKTNKAKATSERMMNRLLRMNTAAMREQLQLQMRINQTFDQMKAHVGTGLVNAFMASGIAIMTFHFKLQQLVDTFTQFEKELMNAQSIFQTTNEVLFSLSDEIVNFGTQYGISLGTAAEGLYTLASAGLSASDSQEVLSNTLKLSMAVQGDHDTIAKLTTQTIFGFGLQMSDSAALTDKFAHAINMSLIEYQDLASAVKFAMPFFVSTGQNVDQLLGSLQVLTNRALEAGIAGRGLRQALSEFAQHAQDSEAAFAKLGVEIMNTDGSFKLLTEIAREFSNAMGPAASDVDLMTTLLEDLNVRGATAFVHLVQNVDEFEGAVNDLSNSAGSATRMADIQQQALANQIQVVKNALLAPFLLSDKMSVANGEMNTFSTLLKEMVADFSDFFIETLPDGTRVLTENGVVMRDLVITGLQEMVGLLRGLMETFDSANSNGQALRNTFHALFIPIKVLVSAMKFLGAEILPAIMLFKTMNMILPVTHLNTLALTMSTELLTLAQTSNTLATEQNNVQKRLNFIVTDAGVKLGTKEIIVKKQGEVANYNYALSSRAIALAQMAANGALMIGFLLIQKSNPTLQAFGQVLLFVAGALMAVAIASNFAKSLTGPQFAAAIVTGGLAMLMFANVLKSATTPPKYSEETYDMGGRIYDSGGALGSRHFPVMVEPGETIVSKTQNMMGGGGITLNIGGDIVTDNADDFAERIAVALPEALRRQNDLGGI